MDGGRAGGEVVPHWCETVAALEGESVSLSCFSYKPLVLLHKRPIPLAEVAPLHSHGGKVVLLSFIHLFIFYGRPRLARRRTGAAVR